MSKTPPLPLTAAPGPRIDPDRTDVPVSEQFGDIYFSVDGGLAETKSVFLDACGLPQRWAHQERFCIGELGFGTGLNFLAVWQLWQEHRPSETARLHFVSIEKFPWKASALRAALSAFPDVSHFADELIKAWPGQVRGTHRLELPDGICLTLIHDDVETALNNVDLQADAWFLDGFSPAKNPAMWGAKIMQAVYGHSAPGAMIGTFTVAGFVRDGLSAAGFTVSKTDGFGRKRHRLEAVKPLSETVSPARDIRPIIIGAGIAGAALTRSFAMRGITVTVIDPQRDEGASGNPAAIVKPRLDLQDRPESRFFLSAYLYARAAYSQIGILHEGLSHIAQSKKEAGRFKKLMGQAPLPAEDLDWKDAGEIKALCGLDAPYGGVYYPRAVVIDPVPITQDWLSSATKINDEATQIMEGKAYNAAGDLIAEGTHIFICAGAGVTSLLPELEVDLQRGQLTYAQANTPSFASATFGHYSIPVNESELVLGATHDREFDETWSDIRESCHVENVESFKSVGGQACQVAGGRASLRVTTTWTLPISGKISDGVYVLSGLGGRGFVHAPLLAETLVSQVCGDPAPLPLDALKRFAPK